MPILKAGVDRAQTDQTAGAVPDASTAELLPLKHFLRWNPAERDHLEGEEGKGVVPLAWG